MQKGPKRLTTHVLQEMKNRGEKISMLTSYDFSLAKIVDEAGIEIILVGDSASNVMSQPRNNTAHYLRSNDLSCFFGDTRGTTCFSGRRFTLWFISRQFKIGLRLLHSHYERIWRTRCKIRGRYWEFKESIIRILTAGIPVMGHLGLTPQSIYKFGTYSVRAQEEEEAVRLISDAKMLEEIGCFGIVLEKIPAELATRVAKEVKIPVIGIGAGGGVDGQVLVLHDMLGITKEFSPRFLRRYNNLFEQIFKSVQNYIKDVKSKDFPNEQEQSGVYMKIIT